MQKRIMVSIRLRRSVKKKIAWMAKRNFRSWSNMAECLLEQEIEHYERENGPIELTEEDLFGPGNES